MSSFSEAAKDGPPIPSNYEDLLLEYYNLRSQLARTNEKWMEVEFKNHELRSATTDRIAELEKHLKDAETLKMVEYRREYLNGWKEARDAIVKEIGNLAGWPDAKADDLVRELMHNVLHLPPPL